MLRRVVKLAACGLVLLALAWGALVAWANSAGARHALVAELRRVAPGTVELAELRLRWDGVVTLVGLRLGDPAGMPLADLPVVEAGWQLPVGGKPPLYARVPGGRVEVHALSWGLGGPAPRRMDTSIPGLPPGALATAGTWEAPPEPLVGVAVDKLQGVLRVPQAGVELPFHVPSVRADLHTGRRVELLGAELRLGDAASLFADGKLSPWNSEVRVRMPEASLAALAAVPPLPMLLVPFGLAPEGRVEAEATLGGALGRLARVQGKLAFRDLRVRMGPEELLREGSGSWQFAREGAGVAGRLELADLAFGVMGLPVRIQAAKGRLEVSPGKLRAARFEGEGPLGPLRGSYQLDLTRGYDWRLDLEVGGRPGSWLTGSTVLCGPAGIRLQGVSLRGPGLDVILETGILPDGLDPPTWRLEDAGVFGTVPDGPMQLRELGGVLYFDNKGGHSFFLESEQGKFQGQVTADGGLKLWVKRSPSAEMRYLDLPASGS